MVSELIDRFMQGSLAGCVLVGVLSRTGPLVRGNRVWRAEGDEVVQDATPFIVPDTPVPDSSGHLWAKWKIDPRGDAVVARERGLRLASAVPIPA